MVKDKKINFHLIGAYLLSVILFLPWLKVFFRQLNQVEQSFWIPAADRWSVPGTIWKMIFGGSGQTHGILIITLIITAIALGYFIKLKQQQKWLILLGLVVPFFGSILISLKTSIYLDRYFVFASLFFSIVIGMTFSEIKNYAARRTLLAVFFALSAIWFFKNWQEIKLGPGMAAAAEQINENATPNDKIYVGSSFVYFTFKYYNHTQIKPLLVSSGPLETIPHFSGTALLNDDDLILDFKPTAKGSQVWLVWTTGFGGSKPLVPGNWRLVEENAYTDTPDFKGQIFIDQYRVN